MTSSLLNRRTILTAMAVLGATALPGTWQVAALVADGHDLTREGKSSLTAEGVQAIAIIADIILPETETPSASQVGVHQFVDHAVSNILGEDISQHFIQGLGEFLAHHSRFADMRGAQQTHIVEILDRDLGQGTLFSGFYRQLKELIVLGFYTSQAGASDELTYDPLPGGYREIHLSPATRTWAT